MKKSFFKLILALVAFGAVSLQLPARNLFVYSEVADAAIASGEQPVNQFRIAFPYGVGTLEESQGSNANEMKAIKDLVRTNAGDLVLITAFASQEGDAASNLRLSGKRAAAVKDYLVAQGFPVEQIVIRVAGEDWDGLSEFVDSHNFAGKAEVQRILDDSSLSSIAKKAALYGVEGGSAWDWLVNNAMPALRSVEVSVFSKESLRRLSKGEMPAAASYAAEQKPVIEDARPVVKEQNTAIEEARPAEEQNPVKEEAKPEAEEVKLAVEEAKPVVVEEAKPVVEDRKPVVEEQKPAPQTRRPSTGPVTLNGRVLDADGLPVPGASVFIPGTTKGVISDGDGRFVFDVPGGTEEIKISCIGYDDVDIDLASVKGKDIEVILKESTIFLESAVAVGYGTPKKIESLVGSVTTVNSESIRTAPSSSALDALQGQVAGLAVLTSGGVAGDNSVSMKLHGTGSLTSSSAPLYIIDGVPSSARSIMSLNPNDIESISILKDASATSIYGARAANGVVHIITKSGSYNNSASITVRSQYGISTITDKSLYENMMSSAELARFWNIAGIHSEQYVKETFYDNGYNADTRWYNYVQQFNNPQYQNDISIEGGGQRVAFLIGASQFHQRGSAIGNVYDRFTLRSNVQGRPKDWLKVGMNMSATYDKTIQNPNWSNSSNNRNYTSGALSYLTLPFYPAIDPETGKEYENEYPGGMINHHTYMANRITPTERLGLMGTAFVTIDFTPDLKLSSRAGVDGYVSRYTGVMKPDYYLMGGSGWRSRSTTYNYTSSLTNTLEYTFDKSDQINFSVLAGHEEIYNDYDYWSGSIENIINPRITLISSGDPETREIDESQVQSAFRSFFGHADFTLDGRYIFDASVRADASSRFGAAKRWGVFWSAGAMWKIKREEFLKRVVWVNDLNLKASYGTSGNANIADYQALNLLGEGGMYNGTNGLYFAQPENPDLSWEKQALLTVALTGKVFDRFDFDVEWYHRKTTDMLMSVPIPATVGFGSQYRNVGALLNTGVDVTLGYDILRTRDSFLHFQTTFNYNAEKVLELFDGRDRWEIANTGVAFVVGHPVMYYNPIYAGVDRNTGKPTWYKPNPDDIDTTTMDEVTDVFSEEDLIQNTGFKRHAPIYGGFSFSGGWKGLSFLADFSYVIGKYMINNDAYFYANPNQFADDNQHKSVSDFWTETNPDAKWPDWRQGTVMQFDTHLIEDASFLRLKNLQIAYSLPKSIMDNISFMQDLKITFTGRNLLTFTRYSGIDPEDDTNVSLGLPANSKQMLLGLELTF